MFKTNMMVAVAALFMAGNAFAGGPNAQSERVVIEPAPVVVQEEVEPVTQPTLPVIPTVVASTTRSHGLWLGSLSTRDLLDDNAEGDLTDGFGDIGYLNYSPVTTGFSPVVGVNFGDVKGFNLGLGYAFNNWIKPYVGVSSVHADDYLTSDAEIGAFAGTQIALPMGLGIDLGVATDAEEIGKSGNVALPFVGIGLRF